MIESAEEFVRLRTSQRRDDYLQAAHDQAPLHVWINVIESFPDMKIWVTRNKTVPLDVLRTLAEEPDPEVRAVVANKRKLSADLFRRLAADPDEGVRARVAHNRKAPTDVLKALTQDSARLVREAALTRMNARS